MRWRILRFSGALLAIALGGCGPIGWTRVTVNRPLQSADVAFIVPQRTTFDEVMARLGAPDEIVRSAGDGLAAHYTASDSRSFGVNLGWPLRFVAPVSFVPHQFTLSGRGIGSKSFEVAFDARGIVTYAAFLPGASAARYRFWPFGE